MASARIPGRHGPRRPLVHMYRTPTGKGRAFCCSHLTHAPELSLRLGFHSRPSSGENWVKTCVEERPSLPDEHWGSVRRPCHSWDVAVELQQRCRQLGPCSAGAALANLRGHSPPHCTRADRQVGPCAFLHSQLGNRHGKVSNLPKTAWLQMAEPSVKTRARL